MCVPFESNIINTSYEKHTHTIIIPFLAAGISAQDNEWPSLDASTMDIVYYPQEVAWRNYLGEEKRNISPKIKLVYSRPAVKERDIFGGLVPYGEEWRLGANEASIITFYAPVFGRRAKRYRAERILYRPR